jgi:hypothetical protein
VELSKNMPVVLEEGVEYSRLFHECVALLKAGSADEVLARTEPYIKFSIEAGMGVYTDAALLRAIALKVLKKPLAREKEPGRLVVIDEVLADALMGTSRTMETAVLDMLCGRQELKPLPPETWNCRWHGAWFAERPCAFNGGGLLTGGECLARDPFVRGVLAWLQGDDAKAREWMGKCVEADQRFSHEYHVAQWLLGSALKAADSKADGEKKTEQPEKDSPPKKEDEKGK